MWKLQWIELFFKRAKTKNKHLKNWGIAEEKKKNYVKNKNVVKA